MVERKVIAEQDVAFRPFAQQVQQFRQGIDILAVYLYQLQGSVGASELLAYMCMRCLYQRGFAHSACAPKQNVVRGIAVGETDCVVD